MNKKTKGQMEAEFTKAVIQFEKEYLGRGPMEGRTFILRDMILVRLRGILSLAEQKLSENSDGRTLVKETRRQLFESSRPLLEKIVLDITGTNIVSLHTDMSTKTGERIIVFTLASDLEASFE
ncbi:MAG: DUF2294 domain-containing protein [Anaerolineae bacterium]|nr:DUF2294 domain-containing protein [Anaerolineae bacterium]